MIQSHNFKSFSTEVSFLCVKGSERMKINLEVKGMLKENQLKVATLAANGCTEFLIGWIKRFGNTLKLFVFPFNKEQPNF
jgi:hypothetical protein